MPQIIAYLTFEGLCREAMNFYKDSIGGELTIMSVGQSPVSAQMPKEAQNLVMHAELKAGAISLMASDNLDKGAVTIGTAINLMLNCASEDEIRSIFPRLAQGGRVNSDLKVEFWGSLYGDITDKYGLRWMLNFDLPKAG
ncbi:MAG TPA: VOC family protein [Rectinemataceae bacterium]|nr:VOC family protein [Rectinemataceae bacterium]